MFYGCSSLKELNISNFNTSNVTNMSYLFYKCSSLEDINVSSWNVQKVENMRFMFSRCLDELKREIRNQNKNIREEAFYNF